MKFVRVTEIKEDPQRWPSNIKKYRLGEVIINSNAIISLREASEYKKEIKMYKGWPKGLDERICLTEISLNGVGQVIYALDNFENIYKKIGVNSG